MWPSALKSTGVLRKWSSGERDLKALQVELSQRVRKHAPYRQLGSRAWTRPPSTLDHCHWYRTTNWNQRGKLLQLSDKAEKGQIVFFVPFCSKLKTWKQAGFGGWSLFQDLFTSACVRDRFNINDLKVHLVYVRWRSLINQIKDKNK